MSPQEIAAGVAADIRRYGPPLEPATTEGLTPYGRGLEVGRRRAVAVIEAHFLTCSSMGPDCLEDAINAAWATADAEEKRSGYLGDHEKRPR